MKKFISMLAVVCLLIACKSGEKSAETPAAVKDAFTKQFANATDVEWSKEGDSEFEAEFKMNGAEMSANFDSAGKLLVTETIIKATELPEPVQDAIAKEFPGYKIEVAETLTDENGDFFELEIESGESMFEVFLDKDGKVLKKKALEEEDEEDEKD